MKWYSRTCGFRRGRYYFWRVLAGEVSEWAVQLATLQSLMLTTTINYMTVTLVLLMLNTIITPWGFLMRGRGAFMREVIVFIDTVGDFLTSMHRIFQARKSEIHLHGTSQIELIVFHF